MLDSPDGTQRLLDEHNKVKLLQQPGQPGSIMSRDHSQAAGSGLLSMNGVVSIARKRADLAAQQTTPAVFYPSRGWVPSDEMNGSGFSDQIN